MKRWQLILLMLLAPFVCGAGVPTRGQSGAWFESAATGRITLVDLANERGCRWGLADDVPALQRAGTCGEPGKRNHFQVLTHNINCNWTRCPAKRGDVSGIALLQVSDRVRLFDGTTIWTGRVIWSAYIENGCPQPQAEFECPTEVCGTAVTSFGPVRPDDTFGYYLVRIAYAR